MIRSFWKVPRREWLTTDEGGNEVQAFGNVVVYDESPQFIYCIAAEEERPDIVGTLLGKSVKAMTAANQARFLRIEVERDTPEGKVRVQVKAADKRPTDVEIRTDVPATIWMGDDPADYLP